MVRVVERVTNTDRAAAVAAVTAASAVMLKYVDRRVRQNVAFIVVAVHCNKAPLFTSFLAQFAVQLIQ